MIAAPARMKIELSNECKEYSERAQQVQAEFQEIKKSAPTGSGIRQASIALLDRHCAASS